MSDPFDYDAERKLFHATIPADNGHCDYVMQGWMTRARLAAEREREMAEACRDLLTIVVDAIMHGMPITKAVADARNKAVAALKPKGPSDDT